MIKRVFFLMILAAVTGAFTQDKTYNTDQLKAAKKISADQWKQMQETSNQRSQAFVSTAKGSSDYFAQQLGYTVIKPNQTLDLKSEVIAVFDNISSAGQSPAGAATARNQKSFKIGPGKFEVKDGVIKRL